MRLTPEEDRRANILTGCSMLECLVFVVIAVRYSVSWLTCLWMVLGGLGLISGSNLLCLAILKPTLARRPWAVAIVRFLQPVPGIAIALYMAGVFTLIIKVAKSCYSAVF
tara:strand:+ start:465 stop:794 length:330 start_codon:yes stop_codon:yes gene_type:complete